MPWSSTKEDSSRLQRRSGLLFWTWAYCSALVKNRKQTTAHTMTYRWFLLRYNLLFQFNTLLSIDILLNHIFLKSRFSSFWCFFLFLKKNIKYKVTRENETSTWSELQLQKKQPTACESIEFHRNSPSTCLNYQKSCRNMTCVRHDQLLLGTVLRHASTNPGLRDPREEKDLF